MTTSTSPRRDNTLRFHKRQLLRVLLHIQQNLDEPMELESMASLACLSPFHFHRIFRGMLGESVMAHVRRLRLERAAQCLHATKRPVIDIALEAGYDSHEAFSRAFKSAFARSPSDYRSSKARCELLHAPSGIHFRPSVPLADFKTLNKGIRSMKVQIETLSPFRVAFVRHVGPYALCGTAWDKLCAWMGKEGLLSPGHRFLGISYDDPDEIAPEKLRYDACVEVDADFQPPSDIGVQMVEGGLYARVTHEGPYEKLSETYRSISGQWLPRQNYRLRNAPSFEVYLNSPENTAPEDLVTDIHVPIEKITS